MIGTLEQLPHSIWESDGELAGALFILDAPCLQSKAWPHIDIERREIAWNRFVPSYASPTELLLGFAAWTIWSGARPFDQVIIWNLDDESLMRVFMAEALSLGIITLAEARHILSNVIMPFDRS
jgi:hypothetical protein